MLKLSFLPGELLAHILHYDDISHVVVALWKCGDVMLNMKMREWVSMVDLEDRNPVSKSRYPLMLSQLRGLRRLRIYHQGHIAPPSILSVELRKLSPMLQELEITSLDGHLPFFDFPATLAPSESFATGEAGFSMWNIGASFPQLIKLVVDGPEPDWSEIFQLAPQLRTLLPPSLEYLKLGTASHPQGLLTNIDIAQCVPETLQTLIMQELPASPSWPPNITHLDGYLSIEKHTELEVALKLPSSVTKMPHVFLSRHDTFRSLALPPSLTSISMTSWSIQEVSSALWMPRTLTEIDTMHFTLSIDALRDLPPSVTRLVAYMIDWTSFEQAASGRVKEFFKTLWPPKLTSLKVSDLCRGLDPTSPLLADSKYKPIFQTLPRSLTELKFGLHSSTFEWDAELLPNLRALHMKTGTLTLNPILDRELPSQLNTLRLGVSFKSSSLFQWLSTLSSLTALRLDQSALHFRVIEANNFFSCLPRKLTSLKTFSHELLFSPTAWSHLPSTLKTLRMDFPSYKHRSWIVPSECFPLLPPKLTSLKLALATPPLISDLQQLRCIRPLNLPYVRSFEIMVRYDVEYNQEATQKSMDAWPDICHVCDPGDAPLDPIRHDQIQERSRAFPDPRMTQRLG